MKLPSSHIKASASSGPEQDAAELLHATWIGEDGTIVIPVDPFYIAKRLGIQVFTASLDQGVSGLLRKEAGYDDPRIYVNSSDSRNRQRFTCAHELGHYIRRGSGKAADGSWEYVDRRDSLASAGTSPEEVYANQFAAGLLMPRRVVEQLARRFGPASLAAEFGVSLDAVNFRLANLRLA